MNSVIKPYQQKHHSDHILLPLWGSCFVGMLKPYLQLWRRHCHCVHFSELLKAKLQRQNTRVWTGPDVYMCFKVKFATMACLPLYWKAVCSVRVVHYDLPRKIFFFFFAKKKKKKSSRHGCKVTQVTSCLGRTGALWVNSACVEPLQPW